MGWARRCGRHVAGTSSQRRDSTGANPRPRACAHSNVIGRSFIGTSDRPPLEHSQVPAGGARVMHVTPRAPMPKKVITLSQLRAACQVRGFELTVGQAIEIRGNGAITAKP